MGPSSPTLNKEEFCLAVDGGTAMEPPINGIKRIHDNKFRIRKHLPFL